MKRAELKIVKTSFFKEPAKDIAWLDSWVERVEEINQRSYEKLDVKTSIGNTRVFALNSGRADLEALVIFPGARTSVLFWDADRGLDGLLENFRVFLVETNGLPNHSYGATPDIKGLGYGHWANEVIEALHLEQAIVAGASFGGLIAMKLAITNPEKVKEAFLLNPGCLQPFSMKWKNLYSNILPIVAPSERNVRKFLDTAVFSKPNHQNTAEWEQLIVDYEVFALTRYKDNTQKPYFMGDQLKQVKVKAHLVLGDKDLLFPTKLSEANARQLLSGLDSVKVFSDVGHGIETYAPALAHVSAVSQEIGKPQSELKSV